MVNLRTYSTATTSAKNFVWRSSSLLRLTIPLRRLTASHTIPQRLTISFAISFIPLPEQYLCNYARSRVFAWTLTYLLLTNHKI